MSRDRSRPSAKSNRSRSALAITHPNAIGIDIGSTSHDVAVPPDRDDQSVREFPAFTADLNELADCLKASRVDIVAMESTGVFWNPLFERLESRGLTVLLGNARHVKHVCGQKSDVLNCQQLQQWMSYGLLRDNHSPRVSLSHRTYFWPGVLCCFDCESD